MTTKEVEDILMGGKPDDIQYLMKNHKQQLLVVLDQKEQELEKTLKLIQAIKLIASAA